MPTQFKHKVLAMPLIPNASRLQNSDGLHNHNCFLYLLQLKDAYVNTDNLLDFPNPYQPDFPYGDLYTNLFTQLESRAETLAPALVQAIYHNDNHLLEHTGAFLLAQDLETTPEQSLAYHIQQQLPEKADSAINHTNPRQQEGWIKRTEALLAGTYAPQSLTNLPTILHYPYQQATAPIEYRFCNQAPRKDGKVFINPIFKQWLRLQPQGEQRRGHIYFNNLSFDEAWFSFPRRQERESSLALHALEEDPSLSVRVVTLPASKGLMDLNHYKETEPQADYASVYAELLQAAQGQALDGYNDLHVSASTQEALFAEGSTYERLLTASFEALGFLPGTWLSVAEKQAVWVHFTKFMLPDQVLTTFKPRSFNFGCKESIDRAALASAYYNLMKSLALHEPLDRYNFQIATEAPSVSVRGRSMNEHLHILWNALHTYIQAHRGDIQRDPQKNWLISWRDRYCPPARQAGLLQIRIEECRQTLQAVENTSLKNQGLKLLENIQEQSDYCSPGLLLELVYRTEGLLLAPSASEYQQYLQKAQSLPLESPLLYYLVGFAECLLGLLLYLPSLSYSQCLITEGISKMKVGFFAEKREQLCEQMQGLPFTLS